MDQISEIKARLDIVEVIGDYIPLKKTGRNYKALCPFHSEKTPSFVVFPDSQNWRCFGCGAGGDVYSFVMQYEGWDFPEALRNLARRAGVELEPLTPQQSKKQEEYERLRSLLGEAAHFFHEMLLDAPEASHARAYVRSRGLSDETVAGFTLGYAPDSWDAATGHLTRLGYEIEDLIEAGLLVVREDGRTYDRFRNRLMIPIRDARGNIVGFGARALDKDAKPKYLNSPQSGLFDKSRLLFGLDRARRSIRESETAVIVEGYMDVMQAHQAGFTNVVAQMGTALTEDQLRLLARYAGRLILALDPDAAGQMAMDRGREVIERVSRAAAEQASEEGVWDFDMAEREYRARLTAEFDPQGMIRYESRLGFDIRVLTLPEGKDPDDVIREDPALWGRLIEEALPVVEHVIRRVTDGRDLNDAKVKSAIARQVVPLINEVADPVERSHYRQRLARLLKVEERALFPEHPPAKGRRSRSQAAGREEAPPAPPVDEDAAVESALATMADYPREAFCLAALIRLPRLIYQINRILANCLSPEKLAPFLPDWEMPGPWPPFDGLSLRVVAADFTHPEYRAIFQAWQAALDQEEIEPLEYLRQMLDPLARQEVEGWLARPLDALHRQVTPFRAVELPEERLWEEAIRIFLSLREARLSERIRELSFMMADMDNGGDASTARQYEGEMVVLLTRARLRIIQARERYTLSGKRASLVESRLGQVRQSSHKSERYS